MDLRTVCVHAGAEIDTPTGDVTPPLNLSSTFARGTDGELIGPHLYGRYGNPTRARLERALAALEGGGSAFAFPSGLAASMAILQFACAPHDLVLFPNDLYFGVRKQITDAMARWGLRAQALDMTNLGAVERALNEGPRLVWLETPSNPMLHVTDVASVAARARMVGALTVVDNTWPTPALTRPLELGADVVLHSTTKYLGGHSDVVGGAVVLPAGSPLQEPMIGAQRVGGSIAGPMDAWLVLRGLRTLALRVRAACDGALAVARWLEGHPAVTHVHYPGLLDDPGHEVAARQMGGGFGGMLSARFVDEETARRTIANLHLWVRATSLGGVESLVEHRALVEGPDTQTPRDLLRFSVGIESPEDLIDDLEQALG